MDSASTFGDWLQQRRTTLALTRAQVAQRVGCSVSALRKIESGERRPSTQIAELLANALEVPAPSRPAFIKVARGELSLERLPSPAPPAAPPPQSAVPTRAAGDRLPVNPTPLIGRERELAELGRLLADPLCRLITLAGPGGVGKTRLAIRAARLFGHYFADGAVFVSLAPLTSASFVVPAVAEALGFSFSGSAEPQAQLSRYLRDRHLLLVLDNLEHLLVGGAAEWLAGLSGEARSVTFLVTSREALDLQAEWVVEVHGLLVEPGGGQEGAAELFLQRARRAQVGFTPTVADEAAIARICQLVGGLPLAIELAAAWMRTLTCAEILQEIEQGPQRLAVATRDLPARHRSLQAVFDHSWQRLVEPEQQVLMRLSVFRGGFTRRAAEQVAGAALADLAALVTKSLVYRRGNGRYDLHELIRQHARERLQATGAEAATRQEHAAWFLDFARAGQAHHYTSTAARWMDELDHDLHNVREALQWALAPAAEEPPAHRMATGLGLACALFDFAFVRGLHHEIVAYFEQLLARPEASAFPRLRLEALTQCSYFYYVQGRLADAHRSLDAAFELNQAIGDRKQLANALEFRGLVLSAEGQWARAQAALEQSLAIWRELKAGFKQAGVLSHLGDIALAQHDFDRAEQLYALAIDPGADMPASVWHPYPPRRLAYLVLRRGDCGRAAALAHESLRLNLAIGDRRAIAACFTALACVAQAQDQPLRAARLLGAAEAILTDLAAILLPADGEESARSLSALRSRLSDSDLAAAWAEGRALTQAQAVDYARQAE